MRAYAEEAVELLGGHNGAALAQDRMRFLAVTRAAEVVGEAAARISVDVQTTLSAIPFRQAIAMRNRLIHGYGNVSADILAETIRADFPQLIEALSAALAGPLPDEAV